MVKKNDPKPPPPAVGDPPASAREEIGYTGKTKKGGRPRLNPAEREEVQRLSELLAEDLGDIERSAEALAKVKEPAKEAKARLKTHQTQLRAVMSGTWQPGMFDNDKDAADGDGSEEE